MATEYGIKVLEKNEEGKRQLAENAFGVFFMPHCCRQLYNNVVWANWGLHTLSSIVVIGNSFQAYYDTIDGTARDSQLGCVLKLRTWCSEAAVECGKDAANYFFALNNTR